MRFTVQDFLLQKGCRNAAIVVVIQMSQPCAVVVSPARKAVIVYFSFRLLSHGRQDLS